MTVQTLVLYSGDGTTTRFSIPFDYIDEADVKVSIYDDASGDFQEKSQADPTYGWSFANASTVEFDTAPPAPTNANTPNIRIQRETDIDDPYAVFSPGSPVKAVDLNDNFGQILYAVQEIETSNFSSDGDTPMVGNLDLGGYDVINGGARFNKIVDLDNNRITGLAAPSSGSDAATKDYVDSMAPQTPPNFEGVAISRFNYTATGGETALASGDSGVPAFEFIPGNEEVYLNGARMTRGVDYTCDTTTLVTFTDPLLAGDVVAAMSYNYTPVNVEPNSVNTASILDDAVTEAKLADWTQDGTGAVPRNIHDKLTDTVSVLDFIPVSEHAAIKNGTTTYDCTANIQAAFVARGSVYFPAGKYIIKSTIELSSDVGGVTEKPRLIGDGGTDGTTELSYEPTTPGGPAFRVSAGGANLTGFKLIGPGQTTGTGEIGIDFRKIDGTSGGSQQGVLIEDLLIDGFDTAGIYISGQWLMQINRIRIVRTGNRTAPIADHTGGIVFDSAQSGLSNWSTSGVVCSNCYFASCSYGIYAEGAWNLTTQNCIFEYCSTPYFRSGTGSLHVMTNPWFEGNGNPPEINGGMLIVGGRAVDLSNANPGTNNAVFSLNGGGLSVTRGAVEQASLSYNGTLSFAEGRGIDFSASEGGSATGSLLDDYEVGNWTPVVTDGSNTASANTVIARYTKIGNTVNIRATILNINTSGLTAGNQIRIGGLPYSTAAAVNTWQSTPITVADITSTAGTIVGELRNSSTELLLKNQTTSGLSNALVSQISSGVGDVRLNFTYQV